MKTILAYRFSAFGDVAMVAIVIREFLEQNPNVQIVMVSRKLFAPLFSQMKNVIYHDVDLENYKGFLGMKKLAKELKNHYQPDGIADLHNVIRSKILSRYFQKRGFPIAIINKGKKEKKQLTDVWNLEKKQLKYTVERYADVFRNLGFSITLSHQLMPNNTPKYGIGFAPFAQHKGKMLPLEKSFELAKTIAKNQKVYFFGGGKHEIEILQKWESEIPNTQNMAGQLTLDQELEKIAELELMISMDSANMHLASFVGTRCISIWGSTHHFAGFLGYGQSENDVVQVSDLSCRPCSVFGDKKCYRGDYACLQELEIQKILEKL